MAEEKKLAAPPKPDPEFLKKIRVMQNLELLQMMNELKLLDGNKRKAGKAGTK